MACVIMMITLAFNVLASNARADSSIALETEESEELIDSRTFQFDDYIKRLTLANGISKEPRACVGSSETIYIAWIDDRTGTDSLFFKKSKDKGASYSPDTEIQLPEGLPIDFSLSACEYTSEVGIAVEIADEKGNSIICYLYSRDSGSNWESALIIGEGTQPRVSIMHGSAIITFLRVESNVQFLSAVVLEYSGSNLEESYGLFSFPSNTSQHDSKVVGDKLNVVWFENIDKQNYLLHLTQNFSKLDISNVNPLAIASISKKADNLQLSKVGNEGLLLSWYDIVNGKDTIILADFIDDNKGWCISNLDTTLGIPKEFDVAPINNQEIALSWKSSSENKDSIYAMIIDFLGNPKMGPFTIIERQKGLIAPTICSISDHPIIIWSEEVESGIELFADLDPFLFEDSILNLRRLIFRQYLQLEEKEQDDVERILVLLEQADLLFRNGMGEDASQIIINELIPKVDGCIGGIVIDDVSISLENRKQILDKAEKVQNGILKKSIDDSSPSSSIDLSSPEFQTLGWPPLPPDDPDAYDITIDAGVTTATISWKTDPYPVYSTWVEVRIDGEYTPFYPDDPPQGEQVYSVEIESLEPITLYYYKIWIEEPQYDEYLCHNSFFTTEDFQISNVAAFVDSPTTAIITWNTNDNGTSVVNYGEDQYNLDMSEEGASGFTHEIYLENLTANSRYYYEVESYLVSNNQYHETSSIYEFWTKLTISNIIIDSSVTTATIYWETNMESNGTVILDEFPINSECVGNSHTVILYGLEGSTSLPVHYHIDIVSYSTENSTLFATEDETFDTEVFDFSTGDIACTNITADSAVITWWTSHASTSHVQYRREYTSTWVDINSTNSTEEDDNPYDPYYPFLHRVVLTDIEPSRDYDFRVHSILLEDPSIELWDLSPANEFTTQSASITNFRADMANVTRATISWTTNFYGSSTVYYKKGAMGSIQIATGNEGYEHCVLLTNLDVGVSYYYYIESNSTNQTGISESSSWYDWYNGLIISDLELSMIDYHSATVNWTTNWQSDGVVEYGETPNLGDDATDWYGTSHSITLGFLKSGTRYYYRVTSTDTTYQDTAVSPVYSFQTKNIIISNVKGSVNNPTSITVTWDTDLVSSSVVEYIKAQVVYNSTIGTIPIYDPLDENPLETKNGLKLEPYPEEEWKIAMGANGTSHSVTINNLEMGYYLYKVTSKASELNDVEDTRGDYPIDTHLILSNVGVERGPNYAIIKWTTNMPASSIVHYGQNVGCSQTKTESASVSDHSVNITGLTGNTQYWYWLESASYGVSVSTSVSTFRTLCIRNTGIHYEDLGSNSVEIVWNTNIQGNSTVEYGTTASYGNQASNAAYTTVHSIPINNLSPNTLYHYRVISYSYYNSSDVAISKDYTFQTYLGDNDADYYQDAGDSIGYALYVVPGDFKGYLTKTEDTHDYFRFYVFEDQEISVGMTVPSDQDYELYLYDPTGLTGGSYRESSTNRGNGVDETIEFTADMEGIWTIACTWYNGLGKAEYGIDLSIFGNGSEVYSLDIGSQSDLDASNATPGLTLVPDTGWGNRAGSIPDYRNTSTNSGFYLTLYPSTYQENADYLLTLSYKTSENVNITVRGPSGTCSIGMLEGTSSFTSMNCLLSATYLFDDDPGTVGIQVRLNVSGIAQIDSVTASIHSFGLGSQESADLHTPGIWLNSGWYLTDNATYSSDENATVVLTPTSEIQDPMVVIAYEGQNGTCTVQQYNGTEWLTLGALEKSFISARFIVNNEWLYDSDSSSPGCNIIIRFSTCLLNVTSITMSPSRFSLDVGTEEDDDPGIEPGLSLRISNWTRTTEDDRTVGYGTGTPGFYLNSPKKEANYSLTIVYKSVYGNQGSLLQREGQTYHEIASLPGDTNWHILVVEANKSCYYDSIEGGILNILFEFSIPVYLDFLYASPDTDGDLISDYQESLGCFWADYDRHEANYSTSFDVMECGYYKIDIQVESSGMEFHAYSQTFEWEYRCYIYVDSILKEDHRFVGSRFFDSSTLVWLGKGSHSIEICEEYVDIINVNKIEVKKAYQTNYLSNDTDGDGLTDYQEIFVKNTSPVESDTDSDGLQDGAERYSFSWSSNDFHKIPDNGGTSDFAELTLNLPQVNQPNIADEIIEIKALVGIVHENPSQLTIKIQRNLETPKTLAFTADGYNLFKSWNLIEEGYYEKWQFAPGAYWTLIVEDGQSGDEGRVEYFKLQMEGATDPLNPDSDYDGLDDSEEVDLGDDGWVTHPILEDTDIDGIDDLDEVEFNMNSNSRTNPTSADTDQDGTSDNVDSVPDGDMMLLVRFDSYENIDNPDGHEDGEFMFGVTYGDDTYFSPIKSIAEHEIATIGWEYYFDLNESVFQAPLEFAVWEDNGGTDYHVDISSDPESDDWELVFPIVAGRTGEASAWHRSSDGSEGKLNVTIKIENRPKANTILINGTDSGLYQRPDGSYRYTADSQLYLFYLNVSQASGPFVEGLNAMIVPRSIALSSQLNDTLMGSSIGEESPLWELGFASTDLSADVSSSSIIAIISGNVTGSTALDILDMVTQNDTETIAENRTVDPEEFYLLGLPDDVIQAVPISEIFNSPVSAGPDQGGYSIWDMILHVVGTLVQGWIEVVDFFVEVFVAAVEFCVEFIVELAGTIGTLVSDAVQILVDAFLAFVDWAISFIQDIVDMVFGPIVEAISNAIENFNQGLASALSKCISELKSTGEISSYAKSQVSDAFYSDLFWILMSVSVLVSIVLVAIAGFTNVFGFILGFAISAITSVLILNAINLDAGYVTQAESEVNNYTSEVDNSDSLSVENIAIAIALGMEEEYNVEKWLFWAIASIFSWYGFMASLIAFFGFEAGGKLGYTSLTVGLAGAVIAFGSAISPELGIFGMFIGLTGFTLGAIGLRNCWGNNIGATICNGIGMVSGAAGAFASSRTIDW